MKRVILSLFVCVFAGASALRAENIGVPSECEDVMLQAFYWDSYKDQSGSDSKYGRTKWVDIRKDSVAICDNFDLVWFPPSATSTGGVGYYHAQLSNQGDGNGTAWGTRGMLEKLIATLHRHGTKAIADIVINHRGNKSSWVDFWEDDFGSYGKWQLTQSHICAGDEAFTSSDSPFKGSSTHGAADTGTNDGGCRDLDHSNTYVQNWAKAYVQWMRAVMKYDGFRYDMTLGYAGSYLSMYNQAGNPYLSVSEYWDGIDKQVSHLKATNYNTMIFDFPLKYVLNNVFLTNNLRALINPTNSLRGKGYAKYAVTFLDNHDTFERGKSYGDAQFAGEGCDLTNATIKNKVQQAYAYLLMMPGVPCVFYPHWKRNQEAINAMIAVRKRAGLHSESVVSNETCTSNVYEATITGHRGTVVLRLGSSRSKTAPDGYEMVLDGGSVSSYTIFLKMNPEGIDEVQGAKVKAEKFVKNGQMFIRVGEKIFDITGKEVSVD